MVEAKGAIQPQISQMTQIFTGYVDWGF